MINHRGVRWKFEVKNVPRPRVYSQRSFLIYQSLNLVYYTLMADLVTQLGIRLFYTEPNGHVGGLDSKIPTLKHSDWRWSFVKALVSGVTPYYMCCFQYTLFSIPAVLLRLSKPEVSPVSLLSWRIIHSRPYSRLQDWPPFCGNLKDATSVRQFWGKYRHQTIRKVCEAALDTNTVSVRIVTLVMLVPYSVYYSLCRAGQL